MLSGRKKTGKGLIYTLLQDHIKDMGEFAFATPIKKFCIEILGLTHAQMYGDSEHRESLTKYKWSACSEAIRQKYAKIAAQRESLTAREVIQVVGTDVMRNNFDRDVWAKAGIVSAITSTFNVCVFSDVRMPNELAVAAEMAPASGFDRPISVRVYRESGLEDAHESETALDHQDAIPNQRTIEAGVPLGFESLTSRLYYRPSTVTHTFDYLLDNNGSLDELKRNLELIVDFEALST